MIPSISSTINVNTEFLSGGGEMGKHIRSLDWSKTAVGLIDTWPQSLRTILSVILNSKFPMFLYWGPEHSCFYNDAFRISLGNDGKHPSLLGKPGHEFWAEAWDEVEPNITRVKAGGEAVWSEDQLIPIYRNGNIENVYWTYSFSPVYDESGAPGGVLVTSIESTQKVLNLKQLEESTDELSFAIEATELATFDLNPHTKKFKCNARLKEWFGLGADEEVDLQKALNVIAVQDRQSVIAAIERAHQHASGGAYDIEYTIVNPIIKQERHVRAKGRAWFNEDKIAYRFNGTLQDITTIVVARKRLVESEQQVRYFIESSHHPIGVYIGREMRIQFANQALKDGFGKGNDIVGKLYRDVLPELENQQVFELMEAVYLTGIPFQAKKHQLDLIIGGEVKTHFFDLSFTPLYNTAGEVYGIVNSGAEVTDLAMAQQRVEEYAQELQESERRFRGFVQASNDTLYRMSADWKLLYTLEGKIFLSTTNKPNKNWVNDNLPPEDQAGILEIIREAIHTKSIFELEHRVIKADGTIGWTFSKAIPILNQAGEIIEWFGAATDITEQKKVQGALENSEQRFRNMADASPILIWTLNPDSSLKYANKFMLNFLGISYEKLIMDNWTTYIHPDDLESSKYAIGEAIEKCSNFRNEHRFLRHDGEYRWLLSQGAPNYLSNGDLYGYVGSSVDFTEIKQAELKLQDLAAELAATNEELRASNKQVQETNDMLSSSNRKLSHINADMDNFIYTASHDLRAPISNIEGLMHAILEDLSADSKENPAIKNLFKLMAASIERFKRTVNDLTEITKLQRQEAGEGNAQVALSQIIKEVVLDLDSQIKQADAEIKVNIQVSELINFSSKNARSIFYNILSNALKFRSQERQLVIQVDCYQQENYQVLSVQDNGLGMDSITDESKIFGMFKRLHDHVEGTGVGLYIVKKIVENAGGKIEVESKVNEGTTFRVFFLDSSNPKAEHDN